LTDSDSIFYLRLAFCTNKRQTITQNNTHNYNTKATHF